jgi:hypothetical protein
MAVVGVELGAPPSPGEGAVEGPLALRGRVVDREGQPIVGARIELSGSTTGTRFTDLTGRFGFHVAEGSYVVRVSAICALASSSAAADHLATDTELNFAAVGDGCVVARQSDVTPTGSMFAFRQRGALVAIVGARVIDLGDALAAQARVRDVAAELPSVPSVTTTVLGGLAVERQMLFRRRPRPGYVEVRYVTLAVAVGGTFVRLEGHLWRDADATMIAWVAAAFRNMTVDEIASFTGPWPSG